LALAISTGAEDHDFVNKKLLAETAISVALRAKDAAKTCRNVGAGGREYWIPSQDCKVLAGSILLGVPLQLAGQYFAHKNEHHRLERIAGYSWLGNLAGVLVTRGNGR
jgi:hypothetical protein